MLVPLAKGGTVAIDDADEPLVAPYRWHLWKVRGGTYAATPLPTGRWLTMHRLLAGSPAGMDVDHRDGDGLNNQRSNLRVCTRAENIQNQAGAQRHSKTGFRGVCWHRTKYQAYVSAYGRQHNLGLFSRLRDAVAAVAFVRAQLVPFSRDIHGNEGTP
jgi:hypothetical protein